MNKINRSHKNRLYQSIGGNFLGGRGGVKVKIVFVDILLLLFLAMPFQKNTKKRGRKPETGGYNILDDVEKKNYHHKAVHKYRGESPSTSSSTPSTSHHTPQKKCPGRPGITGATAMTPTTLRNRKKYLMKQKRKTEKRRLIAQTSRNADDSVSPSSSDDSTPEMSDLDAHTIGGDNEQTPASVQSMVAFKKAVYRKKCKLRGILTADQLDNMRLLVLLQNESDFHPGLKEFEKVDLSYYNLKYFRHRKDRLHELFSSMKDNIKMELVKYWLDNIFKSPAVTGLLQSFNVVIPDELLPKTALVSKIASKTADKFFTPSSNASHEVRMNSIRYIISVAKEAKLGDEFGDGDILAASVNCSSEFACKVLKSIANNSEEDLLNLRKTRFDSIQVTEWPSKIAEFVFRPDNTRAVPGEETVSIRYGVRKQKHILIRSRDDIAKDFKKEYPDCEFGLSVIKREFPPNAVTATTRDSERNTCPQHANIRRVVKAINKILRKNKLTPLPHSCRELCGQVMCELPHVSASEPLTWVPDCVLNRCKSCPEFTVDIPDVMKQKEIRFSLWESRKVLVTKRDKDNNVVSRNKRVFSLYPFTETLENAVQRLKKMLPNLKRHISTAHRQWQAHDVLRNNMDLSTIITIEDYQMNLEVKYRESPTSMAYSSNKKTIAIYPLCVEYLDEEGLLCKGGIVFLSEDKNHDYQQVEAFEERAFEIFREKIRPNIKNWKRFSDGCGSQFWSRFVAADMVKMRTKLSLENISYDRFEADEGKSLSDTLGSLTKCSYNRAIIKYDEGVSTLSDIVNLIQSEMKSSTKKFNFLVIEEFGDTMRETDRAAVPVPNISKLHSLKIFKKDLIGKVWTCSECTVQNICADCQSGDSTVLEMESDDGNVESSEETENFYDESDDGQTDQSSSDESSGSDSEDEHLIHPGDIVWALHGRNWYPARICTLAEIPINLKKRFQNNTSTKFIAWWYGDELYSLVTKVEKLGMTQLDGKRAARSSDMQKLYNAALADLSI